MLAVLHLEHTVSVCVYIYIFTSELLNFTLQASDLGKYTVLLHIMVYSL